MVYHFSRQCLLIMILGSMLCSCKSKPDLEKARQELLALHQEQQTASTNEPSQVISLSETPVPGGDPAAQ